MNPLQKFVRIPERKFIRTMMLMFALGFLAGLALCGVALAVFLS